MDKYWKVISGIISIVAAGFLALQGYYALRVTQEDMIDKYIEKTEEKYGKPLTKSDMEQYMAYQKATRDCTLSLIRDYATRTDSNILFTGNRLKLLEKEVATLKLYHAEDDTEGNLKKIYELIKQSMKRDSLNENQTNRLIRLNQRIIQRIQEIKDLETNKQYRPWEKQ